jgi:curved DNA-binding protein CbpA
MAGDGSAYAALGLEPDADSAEIERAYKRLIKQHHPDRQGGDPKRAAEINRAYHELRGEPKLKEPLDFHEDWQLEQRKAHGWLFASLLLGGVVLVLLLSQSDLTPMARGNAAEAGRALAQHKVSLAEPMDQPLHVPEIDASAREALRISRSRDEMALANASGDCHRSLRSKPSLLQLDRCAAFDDAVVQLEDRDPLRDQGPFSELSVTGRLWSGATELSNDAVAIDGRLDRIRMRVELALASPGGADKN